MRLASSLVLVALLTGCPPDDKKAPVPSSREGEAKVCEKVGQSCEFSPGKLGTCIVKDGCQGAGCFVCQSQH